MMKKQSFFLTAAFMTAVLFPSCSTKNRLPKPDHVVIVVEENHGYDQIIGSANAPYINRLANEGALFTHAQAVTHPSQPNNLALFSGSLQGVTSDKCLKNSTPFTTPNLGAALLRAGYGFTGYAETLPKAGFLECYYHQTPGYDYARKHAPWVDWQGDKKNDLPDSTNQPLTSFPADFNRLPTVSFVIPNEGNDMHNIGLDGDTAAIRRADQWLKDHLSRYVAWAGKHNSLLIFTFDEDQGTDMVHNHIPTFFVGPMVRPWRYADTINHYSVLRTLEAMYHLSPSGDAKAKVITGIWK